MSRARSILTKFVSWGLLVSVVVAAVALIVVPKATGAKPLTVLSGSMTGTYDVGDVVIVRPVDTDQLQVGDVITFQPVSDDPRLTTHRIVELTYGSAGTSFITKGDANGAIDLEPVTPEQVMGEVWYSVPVVGYASVWMASSWLGTVVQLVALGLLLYGASFIVAGLLERRRRTEVPA